MLSATRRCLARRSFLRTQQPSSLYYRSMVPRHPSFYPLTVSNRYSSFRTYRPKKKKATDSSEPDASERKESNASDENTSPIPPVTEQKQEQSSGTRTERKQESSKQGEDEEEPFWKNAKDAYDKFQEKPENEQKGEDGETEGPSKNLMIGLGVAIALGAGYYFSIPVEDPGTKEVSFQEFLNEYLARGNVEKLTVLHKELVNYYLKGQPKPAGHFSIGSVEAFEDTLYNYQLDAGIDPAFLVPVHYDKNDAKRESFVAFTSTCASMAVTAMIMFLLYRTAKGALKGANPFGNNNKKFTCVMPGDKTSVMFKDVAGLDEAKLEVMEFVSFLKNPDRFTRLGAKVPKGALLVGPPGTGKTLLAKATAGEASVPFYSVSGSEFLEMFVGVGPARVRELFKEARKNKPSIIFIDEIDAVGRARSEGTFGGGGHDERENTLNQLLVEMDGFSSEAGVVVLAGTNRADILDKALLRPGRFDRNISIDNADIKGRTQIFGVHLENLLTGEDKAELAAKLAALTPGFSGADIANICNEAALIAARHKKESIELVDFEGAVDRVIGGLQKKNIMSFEEKKLVAYHEAGHAVVGWFLEHADPLLKVTIVPRTSGALGFAQYLPKELSLYQQDQLEDRMAMILGGRAAEQVFFGKISTGASDDLEKVTDLAQRKVLAFGMSPSLPNVSFAGEQESYAKPYSEETACLIDYEVQRMVEVSYARVLNLIEEKREVLELLAEKLLELETINHQTIEEILGPRPFTTDAYQQFLEGQKQLLLEAAQKAAEEVAEGEPAAA